MLESVLPMFSSRSFIVSGFMFRSLMHFEFTFVYGVESVLVSFFYKSLTSNEVLSFLFVSETLSLSLNLE